MPWWTAAGSHVQWVSSASRQFGVHGGDGRHRQLDQFAAAAAQRLRDRHRGLQTRQRVGDRVTAEDRGVIATADQAPGYRGVVAERHPVGALTFGAVAGDPQPDPAVAWWNVRRSEAAAERAPPGVRTRSPRRPRQATPAQPGGSSKSATYESFPPFIQSKKAGGPARAPSGRDVLSTLTTVAPACANNCPQSGPAHIADRSATSSPDGLRAVVCRAERVDARRFGRRLAERGDRKSEQACPFGDIGAVAFGNPALHGRPRVVAHGVHLHQCGNGVDIVGTRQRERTPPVAALHQARRPTRRDPALGRVTEQSSPARDDDVGVNFGTGECAKTVGDTASPRHHADGDGQ